MILDIWNSFRRLPLWVQIWVAVILVPVNLATLAFVTAPYGLPVAVLAIGGMMPNLGVMVIERGFSKTMSLPHLVLWTPLVALIIWILMTSRAGDPTYLAFLWILLVIDVISLAFDFPDAWRWYKGDRAIA